MFIRKLVPALAVFALAAGTALVSADDKKTEKKKDLCWDLCHYFPVRTSLAADKLDGVKENGEKLAKSEQKAIAAAGEELAKAKDIAGARKVFGDLSKALLEEVEARAKKGDKLPQVFVFECEMSKPYGKWLQESKEIGNPYQGSKMPKCGTEIAKHGDEKVKLCGDGCCDDEPAKSEKK